MSLLPIDRDSAIAYVTLHGSIGIDPIVFDTEVADIVDLSIKFQPWEASTEYVFGNKVIPTIRNGFRYSVEKVLVASGTSGAVEPSFWPTHLHARITDQDIVWKNIGRDSDYPYDVNQALRELWQLKADRAAGNYEFVDARQNLKRNQVYENCLKQVKRYSSPRFV